MTEPAHVLLPSAPRALPLLGPGLATAHAAPTGARDPLVFQSRQLRKDQAVYHPDPFCPKLGIHVTRVPLLHALQLKRRACGHCGAPA